MAKLSYNDGNNPVELRLDPGRVSYTIGRNPMCDVRVNNPSMSRRHAEIRLDAATGTYSIVDLGSSNGTFVNSQRIDRQELADGDQILCGEFLLSFEVAGEERSRIHKVLQEGTPSTSLNTYSGLPSDGMGVEDALVSGLLDQLGEAHSQNTGRQPRHDARTPESISAKALVSASLSESALRLDGFGSHETEGTDALPESGAYPTERISLEDLGGASLGDLARLAGRVSTLETELHRTRERLLATTDVIEAIQSRNASLEARLNAVFGWLGSAARVTGDSRED